MTCLSALGSAVSLLRLDVAVMLCHVLTSVLANQEADSVKPQYLLFSFSCFMFFSFSKFIGTLPAKDNKCHKQNGLKLLRQRKQLLHSSTTALAEFYLWSENLEYPEQYSNVLW